MKILRPIGGAAGIFFPVGLPNNGGTCQYATKTCLRECYAISDKDYDEELNVLEVDKRVIYEYFMNEHIFTICAEIVREMKELQTHILHWFASGDCLDTDIERIVKIARYLFYEHIKQNGFTRNIHLWNKFMCIPVRIVLTLENKEDIKLHALPIGVYAIPDYKNTYTDIYTVSGSSGSCGLRKFVLNKQKRISSTPNCKYCDRKKVGCFARKGIGDE